MKTVFLYLLVCSGLTFLSGCGKSEVSGDVVAMKSELVALRGEIVQLRQAIVALSQQTNRSSRPSAAGMSRAMTRTHRSSEEELKARHERRDQLIAEHRARMEEHRRRMEERKAAREAGKSGQAPEPKK